MRPLAPPLFRFIGLGDHLPSPENPLRLPGRLVGVFGLVAAITVGLAPARSAAHSTHTTDAGAGHVVSQDEALHRAFPSAERIDERVLFVTKKQEAEVERLASAPLDSRLWTFFFGIRDGKVLGYAVVDSHVVRTLPQVVMVTLDPSGIVRRVELLAFHERFDRPVDERWLRQFVGKQLTDDLTLGRDLDRPRRRIPSAEAVAAAVRRVLALRQVLIGDEHD